MQKSLFLSTGADESAVLCYVSFARLAKVVYTGKGAVVLYMEILMASGSD